MASIHETVFDGEVVHEQDGRADRDFKSAWQGTARVVVYEHGRFLCGTFVGRVKSNDWDLRLFREGAQPVPIVMLAVVVLVRLGRASELHQNGRIVEEHPVFCGASTALQFAKLKVVFVRQRHVTQA